MSPTARSLRYLRGQGYLVQVVEHWNSYARIRQDLFGCFDILAVKGSETLAVQVTSASNAAARKAKLLANPAVIACLRAGWRCEVHGWARRKIKRGGKAYRFELRTVELTADDFHLRFWTDVARRQMGTA